MPKRIIVLLNLVMALLATNAMAERVLVLGGTGQLGAELVRLLLERGDDVTVFARPTSDRSRLEGMNVEYVVGDLLEEPTVQKAFQETSFDVVVNTVRAPLSTKDFYDIVSRNIVTHAKANGVKQIIHHGAVGAGDNMALHPDVPWAQIPGLEARMLDQGKAEQNFLTSGISSTVIRNARVWPDGTPSTGKARLTEDQSVLTPNTRADLALFTVQCIGNSECDGKIYHVQDESLTWPPPGFGEE